MAGTTQRRSYYPDSVGDSPLFTERPWLARATLIIVSIIILVNLLAALLVAAYQIYYDGLVYPGVSVWGTDLSGMTPEQAAAALDGQFTYPETVTITFRTGEEVWPVSAADLGVRFDVDRTVQAAYDVGRGPNLFASLRQQATAWREGVVASPVIVFDQIAAEAHLREIAAGIDRTARDAEVRVEGLQAVAVPSQIGRTVDIDATMIQLGWQVTSLQSGEVPLVIHETHPQIASADEAAAAVNAVLSTDLELYIEGGTADDPGPWISSRESLASMLIVERVPSADGLTATYSVRLNESQLTAFLEPLAPELARDPVNARFIFNDDTRQLEVLYPSLQGRALNVAATIQAVNQAVLAGTHRVPLVFDLSAPDIADTATASDLGITGLVSSATTYFAGSSQARKNNIATAAARFHGVVVAPGEEFSFNYFLGDVSADTGFDEALIIYNGRTITGVGGGVCQVSTTAFQAAFYAGFPITTRTPHGYRVGYYERGEGAGMDATVFSPVVDMRFINDTGYHLLIETYIDQTAQTLTFRFYSTSDGRTVQKDGPYVTNIVPHGPTLYEENAEVPPGTTRQVDYAVDGADVRVVRTVYRNGEILYQDTFLSHYLPWQAVYQVAPGHLPGGAPTPQ